MSWPEAATPVPSPCVGLCRMNPQTGWCDGCLRTLEQIAQWGGADDDFKRAVWAELRRRAQQLSFD